ASRENPDLEFIMAGRGPLLPAMQRLAEERALSKRISFPGFIAHDDVPAFMQSLDILVNCSRYDSETFGVVICEASACGLPVIATDVGGVRETLRNGETGFLVAREDPQALADAMLKLAEDAPLRKRMGAAGRSFITNIYEWSHCVDLMEQALHAEASPR
ncbi:MAG: glycosyltransferase family 4 protein, partial [Hyphococcus sp.]